jgi:beta-carotene 15,15'-dioxygenase
MKAPAETALFAAAAGTASVAYLAANPGVPLVVQTAVIALLVAVLGLPHGALDPVVARRIGLWRSPAGLALFTLGYLAIAGAVIGVWLLAPVASLVAFLLISAAHFGGDWNAGRPWSLRFLAGAGLLSLPALADRDAVSAIYVVLAGEGGAAIAMVQSAIAPLLLVAMVIAAASAAQRRPHEGIELIIAVLLALTTPPLVFFIVYFCLLHSARHLREGFRDERGTLPRRTIATIVAAATAAPLLVAVGVLAATTTPGMLSDRLLQVVFIGLAALTVPHMIVVSLGDLYADRQRGVAPTDEDDARLETPANDKTVSISR